MSNKPSKGIVISLNIPKDIKNTERLILIRNAKMNIEIHKRFPAGIRPSRNARAMAIEICPGLVLEFIATIIFAIHLIGISISPCYIFIIKL
jgi:hypothetical protein